VGDGEEKQPRGKYRNRRLVRGRLLHHRCFFASFTTKTIIVGSFEDASFTTSAIRLRSTYARHRNWFRIADAIRRLQHRQQADPDRRHAHSQPRQLAELFPRPGQAVHFTNRADLWFGKGATIAKLEIMQQDVTRVQKAQWQWQRHNLGAYADTEKISGRLVA
jgi:hypothetical protein